jgi:flagellar protein FliO/FliZ
MNTLFGLALPTPVNFVIAFVVVLVLIGAATWLVRRFGARRLDAAARGRQPRLAVIDSATVDARRKLIIIRRDNVEHLLMIGGPSDVVVETNIVRATAATREPSVVRNGSAESIPRVASPAEPASWSLQPEPAPVSAPTGTHVLRADRGSRIAANTSPSRSASSEPAPIPAPLVRAVQPADPLASLATELSSLKSDPAAAARTSHTEPAPTVAPNTPAMTPSAPPTVPTADHSLAEMAHRLEAALRRPTAQKTAAEGGSARTAVTPEAIPTREPNVAGAPSKAGAKPQPNNLEQEMASLLSQPGKT